MALLAAFVVAATASAAQGAVSLDDNLRMVCYVAQNAGTVPRICSKFSFTYAPSVREFTETRAPPNTTAYSLCAGCLEFSFTNGVCASGSPVCRLMAEQASTKGILGAAAAFFRAAQTWKVGTDTNSGADHNCHAFGFCGPASHSFLLSLDEERALAGAAADAATRCNGTCDRRPEELVAGKLGAGDEDQSACTDGGSGACDAFTHALGTVKDVVAKLYSAYATFPALGGESASAVGAQVCTDVGACGVPWTLGYGGTGRGYARERYGTLLRAYAWKFVDNVRLLAAYPAGTTGAAALRANVRQSVQAKARVLAQAGTAVVIGGGFMVAETGAVIDAAAGMGPVLEAQNPALAALVKSAAQRVGAGNHTVDYESFAGALVKALPSAQYADAVVQSVLDVVGIAYDDFILSVAPAAPTEGLPTLLAATLVAAPVALLEASSD